MMMQMNKQKKRSMSTRVGMGLILAGMICLVLSATLICYNLWDDYRAEQARDKILNKMGETVARLGDPSTLEVSSADPDVMGRSMPGGNTVAAHMNDPNAQMSTVEIEGNQYLGRLDIPVLGLSLPVMDTCSYSNLKLSPCRYAGSVYCDNLIIAGYNYASHFGNLKDLSSGDPVYFTDIDGNVFSYQVSELEQLKSTDLEAMEWQDEESHWDLTLFTCSLSGSFRVTVRCTAMEE